MIYMRTMKKKITMTSIRRAVSTIVQETHDERLFGVVRDQLTHSKLVGPAHYKNISSIKLSAEKSLEIHGCLQKLVNNYDFGGNDSKVENAYDCIVEPYIGSTSVCKETLEQASCSSFLFSGLSA